MIGDKFNSWTIIGETEDRIDTAGKHHKRVICQCNCGKIQEKDFYKVKNGAKMCKECYLKLLPNNGVPFEHKENKYDLSGEYGIGWTNNDNQEFYFDLEDYDKIKGYGWYSTKRKYIRTSFSGDKKSIGMHQLLCGVGCDHINRMPYDNRKVNLRPCAQKDNARNRTVGKNNTSGVIGVSLDKRTNKYIAYIRCDNKNYRLGSFQNKSEAILSRLNAEKEYFGDFAPQRHLFEEYGV